MSEPAPREQGGDETPPVGGSWRTLYVAVAANLALLIALFYLFTKAFE